MDQQVWNPIFSPSGTTPGKSPSFYNELDQQQQQQQQQQHIQQHSSGQPHQHQHHQIQSNHSTPSASGNIQLNTTSQHPTPSQISGNTPSNFSETDQMFLQQIEYYENNHLNHHHQQQHQQHQHHHQQQQSRGNTPGAISYQQSHPQLMSQQHSHLDSNGPSNHATPNASGMTLPHPPANYDLSLENINFIIPEVLNFDTDPNHVSTAFPPELPSNQTPSLLAVNKMKQQQQQQLQQQQQQHHQRPQQVHHSLQQQEQQDLSSPVLPGQNDKSYNPQHFYHRQSSSGKVFTTSSSSTTTAPSQHVRPDAVFTPLVSPVVTPLEKGNASSSFSPQPPLQISFEPLTSPALNAEPSTLNSGDNSKNNNQQQQQQQHHDDRRRSASSAYAPQKEENKQYKRRTPHGTPILQGSKPSYISPSTKGKNGNNSGSSSGQFTFDKLPDSKIKTEGQDMLPPSGKPVEINGTPLMGFTMGKLAEGGESSAASSSKKSSAKSSRKSSFSKAKSSASSSENSSPKLNKKPEKPATKKASHKLAEQGRRNRMNQAVQELGRLIPQSYHDEVAIPSKATTVELASKYINSLLNEIEELKQNRNNGSNNNDDDDDEMKTKLE